MTATTATTVAAETGRAEARAIRLLVGGDSVRDASRVTGLTEEHVERLRVETPGIEKAIRTGQMPPAECTTPRCGEARQGRPPLGWIKVTVSGRGDALWHCGWACARRYIERKEQIA